MKKEYKIYFLYFLILVYVSGSIGFVMNPTFFSPFTPYTLLFTCFVFLLYNASVDKKFVLAFIAIAVFGYIAEVIGVSTGLIFGNYTYGNGLGYKLFNVPLIISINWALLICAAIVVMNRFFTKKLSVLLFAAAFVTLLDLLIEQVAPKLDFWAFENGFPGVHNYIGWMGVALLTSYVFYPILIKGNRMVSSVILVLQIVFFTSLFIFI